MSRTFKIAAAGATLLSAAAIADTARADEVYQCTAENAGLHFVIYEDGDTPRGGHMYINNVQVAVLDVYRFAGNTVSARAKVVGNTAGTEFILNSSRQEVYVTLGGTESLVCAARVIES